jgi:hypothetical protein
MTGRGPWPTDFFVSLRSRTIERHLVGEPTDSENEDAHCGGKELMRTARQTL